MKVFTSILFTSLIMGCMYVDPDIPEDPNIYVNLPDGFSIELYAGHIENPRGMALSPNGILYVGSRSAGNVYALVDIDGNFEVDRKMKIASGLNMPVGVAWKDGDLYVSAVDKILRYSQIDYRLDNPPAPEIVTDQFPSDQSHGWKYIAFGPDDKLYIPVGAPCNICDPEDEIYSTITRINSDGSDREIIAHGVRNTVGFDWHPETGELWFTDNGRDRMGDDIPPCELNRLVHEGAHFGFPWLHGNDVLDPEFGEEGLNSNLEMTPPVRELDPHVAPLGMLFYTGKMFPEEYKNQVFIAEHGSWNRSEKIGYRITLVTLDDEYNATSYQPFAEGWLRDDENVYGRPVDLIQYFDGSLLLSDDYQNKIYRISYSDK
ncbi:MAG: sorbosone dehydrogenase family protein [Balneolaceae bacterium]